MKKISTITSAAFLSMVNISSGDIEDSFDISIGLNKAYANEDTKSIEIITAYGRRFSMPDYQAQLILRSTDGGDNQSQESYDRWRDERDERSDREGLCRLQPEGCSRNAPPSDDPNGCSTPYGTFPGYRATFNNQCNSHDLCYSGIDTTQLSCDAKFREDMHEQCRANQHAAAGNGSTYDYLECKAASEAFYAGVRIGGEPYFQEAKKVTVCLNWIHESRGSKCE